MLHDEYRVMYGVEDNHWWYRGMRHNLLTLLKRHWNWEKCPQPQILDAGCGTGANLAKLLNGFDGQLPIGKVVGFDLAEAALAFCQQRNLGGQLAQASITELPFADNQFDIIISFDVINNLPDDRLAFAEISRVLRPGGLAILNLPAYQFLYSEHDLAIRGRRRYDAKMVAARLNEVGLKIERQTYLNTLLFLPAAFVRLIKKGKTKAAPSLLETSGEVHTDLTPPPALINKVLGYAMGLESLWLGKTDFNLPFGLSIMTLARK